MWYHPLLGSPGSTSVARCLALMNYLPTSTGRMPHPTGHCLSSSTGTCCLLQAACPDCPVLSSFSAAPRLVLGSQNHRKLSDSSMPSLSSLGKVLRGDHHFIPGTQYMGTRVHQYTRAWWRGVGRWGDGWLKPRCQGTALPAEPSWAPPPPPAASPIFLSPLTRGQQRLLFHPPQQRPGDGDAAGTGHPQVCRVPASQALNRACPRGCLLHPGSS